MPGRHQAPQPQRCHDRGTGGPLVRTKATSAERSPTCRWEALELFLTATTNRGSSRPPTALTVHEGPLDPPLSASADTAQNPHPACWISTGMAARAETRMFPLPYFGFQVTVVGSNR